MFFRNVPNARTVRNKAACRDRWWEPREGSVSSSLRSSINALLPTFLTDAIDWIVATYARTSTCSTVPKLSWAQCSAARDARFGPSDGLGLQ